VAIIVTGFDTATGKIVKIVLPDVPVDISDLTDITNIIPVNLSDLNDILFTSLTDGQYLKYDLATSKWVNATLTGLLPSGTSGQTLRHNGTIWIANSVLTVQSNSAGITASRAGNSVQNITNSDRTGSGTDIFLVDTPATYDAGRIAQRHYIGNGNGILQLLGYSMTSGSIDSSAYHLDFFSYLSGVSTRVFKVFRDGKILSNSLTAKTILMANASKEIISIADGTSGQALITDGAGNYSFGTVGGVQVNSDWNATSGPEEILNKPDIPEDVSDLTDTTNIIPVSHSSFLPADHLYYNLQVTPPLNPVITSFYEIGLVSGTSTFKVSLKGNKRYAFEARILIANPTAVVRQFQIKLICPTGWGVTTFTDKSEVVLLNYPDVSLTTTNQYKIVDFAKNTEYGFYIDDDNNMPYLDLYIKGIIDTTGTDGNVTFEARNTFRAGADNSNILTFKVGSYMKAIETEIN
jgi:hypothetical protein